MSKTIEFVVILDNGVRKRHSHKTQKGKVVHFVVQLELKVKEGWKAAVRYDCSHGFSHVDQYDIKGNQAKKRLNISFESALTLGDWDINENWQKYKQEFFGGVEDE